MKKEKIQDSVLLNQNLSLNLNTDRIDHIKRLVHDYLKSGISEISILNVAEASTVFKVFKDIFAQYELERKGVKREGLKSVESSSIRSKDSLIQSLKSFRSIVTETQKVCIRSNYSSVLSTYSKFDENVVEYG